MRAKCANLVEHMSRAHLCVCKRVSEGRIHVALLRQVAHDQEIPGTIDQYIDWYLSSKMHDCVDGVMLHQVRDLHASFS